MSLLNLSLAEFAAIFGAISAVLVTLYLFDRSRRKVKAASLRFWKPAAASPRQTQRRRIQQPWSLILQLVSITLLLLAVGELVLGSRSRGRDHVLILDTSAWMGARTGNGTLMDQARASALAYLRSLPSADRVLLIRADALATPAGALESNRAVIASEIRQSRPGASALNLQQAFGFAQEFERLQTDRPGEIVYAGAARVRASEPVTAVPGNLRILPVSGQTDNLGLRKIGLKSSENDAAVWQVFVAVRNYGTARRTASLELRFAGALIGVRTLVVEPNSDQEATFPLRTHAAGLLEARIVSNDAFPEDDRASIELPSQRPARVAVFTAEADSLRPALSANPRVSAEFHPPSEYRPDIAADVVIFDRFIPPAHPAMPAIYLEPPAQRSPVPVRATVSKARLKDWNQQHELGAGLRTHDVEIESASVFAPRPGDIVVAAVDKGPVIVAHPGETESPRYVVFGFNPVRSGMRYELATPLLFANVLRWIHPATFRRWELNAGVAGVNTAELGKDVDPASVSVRSETVAAVPYTVESGRVSFFAGSPGIVRVVHGDREIVYSLTLPDVGETVWRAPDRVRRGVPRSASAVAGPTELWPWLAVLGALGIAIEWMLFGRGLRRLRLAWMGRDAGAPWWRRKAS